MQRKYQHVLAGTMVRTTLGIKNHAMVKPLGAHNGP